MWFWRRIRDGAFTCAYNAVMAGGLPRVCSKTKTTSTHGGLGQPEENDASEPRRRMGKTSQERWYV
jgi:hypothetical protein